MVQEPPSEVADPDVTEILRRHRIGITRQRVAIARVLFARRQHVSADDLLDRARSRDARVSRATVYNTLKLFRDHGLVSEVIVDPSRVFYDTETAPHYHLFDVATGELTDIPAGGVEVTGLPALPQGTVTERMDIVIRTRSIL